MPALGTLFKDVLIGVVNGTVDIFDYGAAGDFSQLWDAGDGTPTVLDTLGSKQAIVIVWDGRPLTGNPASEEDPNEKLVMPHLTPLDWALAFSIKVLANAETAKTTNLRIHIIDLTGKTHDEWAMRMRHQLLVEMPWVTLHAPLIPTTTDGGTTVYREGYRPILGDSGLLISGGGAWSLNSAGTTLAAQHKQGRGKGLTDLAKQWAASLTQSHDHHDLNNVVGPWIVMSELINIELAAVRSETPLPLREFLTRLGWIGLLGDLDGEYEYKPLRSDVPFNFLAIDDELVDKGWWDVLGALWATHGPIPTKINITQIGGCGFENPENMFKPLGIETSEAGTTINETLYSLRSFDASWSSDLDLDAKYEVTLRPWLLVLDLHLFSGQPRKEREWFKTLREAAGKLTESQGLAWQGFTNEELDDLDRWFGDQNSEDLAYDTALSLFPRLCALRWPSVPIMVFSVSGRRTLITKLAGYGNIFLAAPKPNVFVGDAVEQVHAFAESWGREFDKAMRLVKVQEQLIRLRASHTPPSPQNGSASHCHIVIALDETGPWGGSTTEIGGVILFAYGKDEVEAKNTSVDFQESLRRQGVHYYDCVPYYFDHTPEKMGEQVTRPLKKKGNSVKNELATAVNLPDYKERIRIGFVRYSLANPNVAGLGFTDETYLRGLSRVIEIMLAEFLPSAGFDFARTTCSIWFPSKQSPQLSSENEARNHGSRFDFRYEPPRTNVETIGGYGSAYSILLRAVGERSCFGEALGSIKHLKTRTIPYSDTGGRYQSALHWYCPTCKNFWFPKSTSAGSSVTCNHGHGDRIADYSVLLHLADEMITSSTFGGGYHDSLTNRLCFDIEENDRTLDFLQAARLFDRRLPADGFKVAYRHDFFLQGVKTPASFPEAPIQARLVGELANHAIKVDGNTLMELAGLPTRETSRTWPDKLPAIHHNPGNKRPPAPKRSGPSAPKSQSGPHKGEKREPKLPDQNRSADVRDIHDTQSYLVLSDFKSDITQRNVVVRVYDYLTKVGITVLRERIVQRYSKGLKCDVRGLSDDQCDRVSRLLTAPPIDDEPPWRKCNIMRPPKER